MLTRAGMNYGDMIEILDGNDAPEYSGYVFKGWYDNAELLGDVYTQTKKSESKDMKFYAKWNGAVYSYTFKLDGGTLAKDSNINDEFFDETNNTIKETFGETIKLPKVYK